MLLAARTMVLCVFKGVERYAPYATTNATAYVHSKVVCIFVDKDLVGCCVFKAYAQECI